MPTPRPVAPLAGAAPYQGGKRNLASKIIAALEAIPHETYAEPFVGMGGVFFRRRSAPRLEVINDRSRDVATFFRVLQRHYLPFVEMLRWQLTTRVEFERLVATDPTTLTDLERAARFYYLQRTAFGGKVRGRTFGVDATGPARFDVTRLIPELEQLHSRLTGVVVECLPFEEFIPRYDKPATLFYLDPPYWGCEKDYGVGMFAREDFERLAQLLAGIRGQFLLSLNDTPEVREIFGQFVIYELRTTYTVGAGQAKAAREVLIASE
ncbi:MAG: class adenine-specific methyltransferase [Gemmatimonadetes bacterium]|nr:class adenine-specific methyltransferase [Gemmatimonadota bacterium]